METFEENITATMTNIHSQTLSAVGEMISDLGNLHTRRVQSPLHKEKPELSSLMRELSSLASDWKHIGVQLKIPIGQLNTIKSDNDRAKDCLMECWRCG